MLSPLLAAPPNDTTKFELAFLIIWILLSVALLALVLLRKVTLPNLIQGDRTFSLAFAGLQFVLFVLLLAALAADQWTTLGAVKWGVSSARFGSSGTRSDYDTCSGCSSDVKNYQNTVRAAGAFTLIFGLIAILTALVLLVGVLGAVANLALFVQINPHAGLLSTLQLVCLQAMVFIWGVSGSDPIRQGNPGANPGPSWALTFVCMILAIPIALFYAGGVGGAAGAAMSAGPSAASKSSNNAATQRGTAQETEQQQALKMQETQQPPPQQEYQQPQQPQQPPPQQQLPPVQQQTQDLNASPEGMGPTTMHTVP